LGVVIRIVAIRIVAIRIVAIRIVASKSGHHDVLVLDPSNSQVKPKTNKNIIMA